MSQTRLAEPGREKSGFGLIITILKHRLTACQLVWLIPTLATLLLGTGAASGKLDTDVADLQWRDYLSEV